MADDETWRRGLWGEDHELLQRLINQEPPPVVLRKLELYVRQLYMLGFSGPEVPPENMRARIAQISAVFGPMREMIGGWQEQRVFDIEMLRLIRTSGALSLVLGAGAAVAAGVPSWAGLVGRLLTAALERGREIYVYEPMPRGARAKLVATERLSAEHETLAREILADIEAGPVDADRLMQAAQLCHHLFRRESPPSDRWAIELFQHITMILYPGGKREPSPIHHAIAALAHDQDTDGPRGRCPGWVSIITYNFDSLMNDALDREGIGYTCRMMIDGEVQAFARGEEGLEPAERLPVLHLHGFTPRQPFFDIRGVDFVFSQSQYERFYAGRETIVDVAMDNYISNPALVCLYVGCSFTDQRMNELLERAAAQHPGRHHYAFLKLPEAPRNLGGAEAGRRLSQESEPYVRMGVQPIWVQDYDEIPELIMCLA